MGHMEKLWDKAVAKESYSANGDLDYDDEIDDFDAYAATEEGVCWCGNDGCGHIQDNPQKQCCVCTDASDVDSMCGECQSLVSSYSAVSRMPANFGLLVISLGIGAIALCVAAYRISKGGK